MRSNRFLAVLAAFSVLASARAAAQMLVYDVNGDGLNDIITSLNCHGYGLAWYEQARTGRDIGFRQHLILNADATAAVVVRLSTSVPQASSARSS